MAAEPDVRRITVDAIDLIADASGNVEMARDMLVGISHVPGGYALGSRSAFALGNLLSRSLESYDAAYEKLLLLERWEDGQGCLAESA